MARRLNRDADPNIEGKPKKQREKSAEAAQAVLYRVLRNKKSRKAMDRSSSLLVQPNAYVYCPPETVLSQTSIK